MNIITLLHAHYILVQRMCNPHYHSCAVVVVVVVVVTRRHRRRQFCSGEPPPECPTRPPRAWLSESMVLEQDGVSR